ncbi:MAG: DUF2802 domain-containing protein [Gammaproteobacteria bacterium]|nr:DUF2802 domain-containing protein [Gammaproteobacteria bacterium]
MMEISDVTTLHLLLISNAALLAAAVIAIVRFQKQCRRFEQFWNSPTGAALAGKQPADEQSRPQANRHLERRVTELQSVVRTLAKKGQVLAAPKSAEVKLPIENAVRMARHGATIDDLVRSCGLNIGEARLMQKLHGKAQAAAKAV